LAFLVIKRDTGDENGTHIPIAPMVDFKKCLLSFMGKTPCNIYVHFSKESCQRFLKD
jgi:hypothetical protein